DGQGRHEAPGKDLVAREHVRDRVAEENADEASEQSVAELMPWSICAVGVPLNPAYAVDQIILTPDQGSHHLRGAGRVVGIVSVHNDVDVRLHVPEHPPDDIALSGYVLEAHVGSCLAGHLCLFVAGAVVVIL